MKFYLRCQAKVFKELYVWLTRLMERKGMLGYNFSSKKQANRLAMDKLISIQKNQLRNSAKSGRSRRLMFKKKNKTKIVKVI
jgi:hypothetical protein